jgi:putative lipoprotein
MTRLEGALVLSGTDLGYHGEPLVERRPRKSTLRMFTVALVGAFASIATNARAAGEDPFWGRDKALHFAFAGAIAGAGYGVTTAATPDRWKAFAVGGAAAVGAGALKEGLDAAGLGDPSWKDFAWDVIGAACGLGVAWALDVAVHGGTVPAWSASTPAAVFRF